MDILPFNNQEAIQNYPQSSFALPIGLNDTITLDNELYPFFNVKNQYSGNWTTSSFLPQFNKFTNSNGILYIRFLNGK